ICSDKTGTLTMNQMTVTKIFAGDRNFDVTGNGYSTEGEFQSGDEIVIPKEHPALMNTLIAGAVCNDASLKDDGDMIGDPTEGALLVSAAKGDLYLHLPRLDEIPFESETQCMATLDTKDDKKMIYLKGSTEKIVVMCNKALSNDGSIIDIDREAILNRANDMASSALRVIAIAEKEVGYDKDTIDENDLTDLVFLGLQGMIDPPRPEAIDAIKRCQGAKIRVVMITGDHAVTAGAIAAKLGIASKGVEIVTGHMLEAMDDDALYDIVEHTSVYARASPIHKFRIVQQLRKHGEIIAVTGDGVNDAPALKAADIGISMGIMGTDVTKEASDMILADDNFATIVNAVEEGRHMYNNLQKMLTFLIPTSIGQASVITIAILAGLIIPLMPVHVLWINLVTSVTCTLPLALEGKEKGILQRPPRDPKAPLISNRMLARVVMVSSIMMLGAFISFYSALNTGASEKEARTVAMSAIVMMEIIYIFSSRSFTKPALSKGFFSNKWIFAGAGLTLLLQLSVVYIPVVNSFFNTSPISMMGWMPILASAGALFAFVELEKIVMRKYNTYSHNHKYMKDPDLNKV
ncbi:MAG: HAD-IC family P-type ATPase, partial [Thermoplasmata archaeon]|nr:HAD-IC family P-type ATPase [Thermoplasmata archaeon]